jgi:hypothetical protein
VFACFDRVKPLVDETVRRLAVKAFRDDPIAGTRYARATRSERSWRELATSTSAGVRFTTKACGPCSATSRGWLEPKIWLDSIDDEAPYRTLHSTSAQMAG